jgi:hypothetical protein
MQIYRNPRTWPTKTVLWLTAGGAAASLIYSFYGYLTGDSDATALGLIYAGLLAIMAIIIEAAARHLVFSIDLGNGSIGVETLSILGRRRREIASAAVGKERQSYRIDGPPDFESPIEILGSVAELLGGGEPEDEPDSRWRPLKIPGKRIPLLIDVTADPAAGERVAEAIAAASAR